MAIILIIAILVFILEILIRLKETKKEYTFNGERNEKLLTNNELKYFNLLKQALNNTEYYIFVKVRLADLIKTKNYIDFNKVRGKHIDFIICDKNTKPILFIELDDFSHKRKLNAENDKKKDYLLNKVGINIIRTTLKDASNSIQKIKEKLGIINYT